MIWEEIAAKLASHGFSNEVIQDVANLIPSERERLLPRLLALRPVQVIHMNQAIDVSQQGRAEFDGAMTTFNRTAGEQG